MAGAEVAGQVLLEDAPTRSTLHLPAGAEMAIVFLRPVAEGA